MTPISAPPVSSISSASVRVSGLVKHFVGPDGKPFRALDDLSFTLPDSARLIVIAGPDGAGKSTLLRILAGLLTADDGTVSLLGHAPGDKALARRTGFMPQKFGLYEELSVRENLETFSELLGVAPEEARDRCRTLLTLTGLAGFEDRKAGALSGGMKQKLGLTASLLATPELLFLDEPTVGVDPLSRRELWAILRERSAATGMRTLVTTSNLEETEGADWVLMLSQGRLLAATTPADALATLADRTFSLRAVDPADARALSRGALHAVTAEYGAEAPFLDARPQADAVTVLTELPCSETEVADRLARAGLPAAHVVRRPAAMEDVYADRTFSRESSGRFATPAISAGDESLVVEAEGICRRFGSFTAVADTSFTVRKGEIFGLLGPNGAGKTTTFRMLCGLLAPSAGRIRVCGVSLLEAKSEVRSRIGYVAQKFSLYDKLTVRQNLDYFGRSYGLWGPRLRNRVEEAIERFRLRPYASERTGRLPLGAKRELAFAAALLHAPDILFLDEATSGADVEARRAFWRRIVALSDLGVTTVVTTHYMEEAHYCDRFLIQDRGRVLILGTPDEVRRAGATPERPEPSMEEAFIEIVERARREGAS